MWSDSDGERELTPNEVSPGRNSSASEVVVVDPRAFAAAVDSTPTISHLNVSQKSKVHVGPKFVSVTQNVNNAEMVKTRFLGLELISAKNTLRCSIAVFVCWALVVAVGLILYLVRYVLPAANTRLDLDLALPCYLWTLLRSTSWVERAWCIAGLSVIAVVVTLIVVFRPTEILEDIAPHEWNITRSMWLAQPYSETDSTAAFEPLRLVVLQHSVSSECYTFITCAAEMRILQSNSLGHNYDIPYNFLVGNDGRLYEGRGWGKEGAHTQYYNRCALGIGFVGDYRNEINGHSAVSELQVNRTMMLLDYGVAMGYLHPEYRVIAASDIQNTESPGSNLYQEIITWKHYLNGSQFLNYPTDTLCEKIYALLETERPVQLES